MKTRLIILFCLFSFLLSFSPCFGGSQHNLLGVLARKNVAAGGWPDFTYDIWIDYESNSDCTDAELEKTDHNAAAQTYGGVTTDDIYCHDTDAEKNGTYGLEYDFTNGAARYLSHAPASAQELLSWGFWWYTPDHDDGDVLTILVARHAAGNLATITWNSAGGTDYLRLYGDSGSANNTTVTAGNWYWITGYFDVSGANTTFKTKVYDTGENLIGAEMSATCDTSKTSTEVRWGACVASGDKAVSMYFDETAFDWGTAEYKGTGQ